MNLYAATTLMANSKEKHSHPLLVWYKRFCISDGCKFGELMHLNNLIGIWQSSLLKTPEWSNYTISLGASIILNSGFHVKMGADYPVTVFLTIDRILNEAYMLLLLEEVGGSKC